MSESPPLEPITRIVVRDNGPLRIHEPVLVEDGEGNPIPLPVRPGKTWISLCRCGQSQDQPFCDDSHKQCGFSSVVRAAEVTERLKRTGRLEPEPE